MSYTKLIYKQKYHKHMDFKANLNRLHYLLTERFKNVTLLEKSNSKLGEYIELLITEGHDCKIIIKKRDLESNNFTWSYSTNPLNESANHVERTSTVDNFTNMVVDILENKRFDSEYIKS